MPRTICARLDEATEGTVQALARRFGWSHSQVVREGIKALSGLLARSTSCRIIGLGRFCSGVPDLGSDTDHLQGFGR